MGLLGAIGNGVTQPVVLVVFGDLIDGMGGSTVPVELPANLTAEQMALLMEDAMDGMMGEMEPCQSELVKTVFVHVCAVSWSWILWVMFFFFRFAFFLLEIAVPICQERLCIIMCLIGVANTVAATLQGACFKIFSDTQSLGV